MLDFLQMVRLPLLSTEIIKSVIRVNPLCSQSQKCCNYIDLMLFHKRERSESSLESPQNESRCSMHGSVACMFHANTPSGEIVREAKLCKRAKHGFDFESIKRYLEFHDINYYVQMRVKSLNKRSNIWFSRNSKDWKKVSPDPDLENFASCLFMGKLYILGGLWLNYKRGHVFLYNCWVYEPKEDKFYEKSRMLKGRLGVSCVVFNGKIVVTGGIYGTEN